ncbi:MAG: hypothetical protein IT369_07510, partial [Candidatus Latescibacteria bacterium]|nr:hypothetical protein [Candidatus Latescibacterota bacterium]
SRGNASPRTWRLLLLHYLARPVLEQVYPEWQTEGGGFGPQGLALVSRMVDLRRSQGLVDPPGSPVQLTSDGFLFTGKPLTPPRHWEALIRQLSPNEIRRTKHLLP